jgi:hypothetical protein
MILHEAHTFVDQASSRQASVATSIETKDEAKFPLVYFFPNLNCLDFYFL